LERDVADPLLKEALALSERAGDELLIAECFEALGIAHRSDADHGIPYFERAIETFRRTGADRKLAHALFSMTYRSLMTAGRFDDARAALEESLRMSLRDGSRHTAAHAIAGLGKIARLEGDRDEAERTFRFALGEFREIGDRRCIARMLTGLALIAEGAEDANVVVDDVWSMLRDAIDLALDVDPEASPEVTETADALVVAAARDGHLEDAARWLGAVDAIRERDAIRRTPPDEREIDELRGALSRELGADHALELRTRGAATTLAQVADEVRAMRRPRS
jgi:tetratricopeptide (TPR) repeat protein